MHVDADPGLGDLLALAVGLGCPQLEITGVTTVAGSATLENVSENTQRFLALAGVELPIGRGRPEPLELEPALGTHVHGEDGRRAVSIPALDRRPCRSAVEVLRESLEAGAEVVVALGPLSNLADLLRSHPEALRGAEILWLGGARTTGDASAVAEFNAFADPHAAAFVLDEGARRARGLRVIGLEVGQEARLWPADLPDFGPHPRGRVLSDVIAALVEAERPVAGPSAPLSECATVLAAADLELFRWSRTVLEVDRSEGCERGRVRERPFGWGRPVECAREAHRHEIERRVLAGLRAFAGEPA